MNSTTREKRTFTLDDFEKGLMLAGFITPTTVQELDQLEILAKHEKVLTKEKAIIYFKRAVLAAEIVDHLYGQSTFGRVKFQKLVYLCEHAGRMNLQNRYAKFAAGPFDNKFMHSINREFRKQKWFNISYVTNNGIKKPVYSPGPNHEKYKAYYEKYFSEYNASIQELISIFKYEKTRFVELVATVFYCWVEIKEDNQVFNDATLLDRFYSWADEKKKFSKQEIQSSVIWMRNKGITPT